VGIASAALVAAIWGPASSRPASASLLSPTVSAISPASGSSSGGTSVTVDGSNFVTDETTVSFGGVPGTAVRLSSTSRLTVTAPPESYTCPGTVDVTVTTPLGTSPTSSADLFSYLPATPSVTSIAPATGSSATSTTVDVSGTNLMCPVDARVGTISGTVVRDTSNTPSHLRLVLPPQSGGTIGDVVVNSGSAESAPFSGDVFSWVAGAPSLAGMSTTTGASSGGDTVTLSGLGLSFATQVSFGAVPSPSFTVNSDQQISAVTPPGCGTVPVSVATAGGVSQSLPFAYSGAAPSVSALSPTSGPTSGNSAVVIAGSGLLCATGVKVGGLDASSFHVDSDAQITAIVPSEVQGIVDVVVTTLTGSSPTGSSDHYVYDRVPVISSLSPDSGPVAGGNTVTVNGQNFDSSMAVSFGGTPATSLTVTSSTSALAVAPPSAVGGPVEVVVSTSGGTASARYVYAMPSVTAVTPAVGPVGGGADVRISGSNFAADSRVSFGGQAVTATVVSPTLIDVTSSPLGSAGSTVDVIVTDAAGSSALIPADHYQFAIRPKVTSIAPQTGSPAGGATVTIVGTGLTNSPSVLFGDVRASAVVVNGDGTLTATGPPGTAGTSVDITVQTYGGTSGTSAADVFSYTTPQATSLFPIAGPLAGGTSVTITGTGFGGPTTVSFGGTQAPSVSVPSSTQVVAVSPPLGAPRTVTVVVTSNGTSTTAGSFSYDPPPTLASVAPDAGSAGGGTAVTVTGTGFLHGVAVSFVPAGSPNVASTVAPSSVDPQGTWLTVTTPAIGILPPAGVFDIVVFTSGGQTSVSPADQFAYGAPTVTGVSPPGGLLNAGTAVTITGTGFVPGAAVSFGQLNGIGVVVLSPTAITVTSPVTSTSGIVGVTVSTAAGSSPGSSAATFTDGPPVLSSITPTMGSSHGGQALSLVVVGNFVDDGVRVSVGGAVVTSYVYNAVQQTVTITTPPSSTTTSAAVSVTLADDGGTSTPMSFTYWAPPTITSVTPSAGPTSGNRSVTISGSNFVAGQVLVFFGGVAAQTISNVTQTSMSVLTPAHAAGTFDIQVENAATSDLSAISTPDRYLFEGQGYWMTEGNGTVRAFGGAGSWGSYSGPLNKPIVGMAETPDGRGYWLAAADGGIFTIGDASGFGSMGGTTLNAPVSGIAATPDGKGYWMVGQDGGVFTFGTDAAYYGGLCCTSGQSPVVGIAATHDGKGYWLVQANGRVTRFGDAVFLGDASGFSLNAPVVGIVAATSITGYWLVAGDGGVWPFPVNPLSHGSIGGGSIRGIVTLAPTPTDGGYWLIQNNGAIYSFADANPNLGTWPGAVVAHGVPLFGG
jgi:hypothetical protein